MRLVENHCVTGGQQFCRALVAQHHIGKEQMVINHHQIGSQRLAPGSEHEAFLVVRAILAKAVLARRGHQIPHRRIFRHRMAISLVASLRLFGEAGDTDRVGGVLTAEKTAIGLRSRQMVMANVIGAPLEQRHAHRRSQRLPDRRDVLGEQLILEVLGAG